MNEPLSLVGYSDAVVARICPTALRFGSRLYLVCIVAALLFPKTSDPAVLMAYATSLAIFLGAELRVSRWGLPPRYSHLLISCSGALMLATSTCPYLLGDDPYLTFYLQLLLLGTSILLLKVKWVLGTALTYVAIWGAAKMAAQELSFTEVEGVLVSCVVALACHRTRRRLLVNEFELHCQEKRTQEQLRQALAVGETTQQNLRLQLADELAQLERAKEGYETEREVMEQALLRLQVSSSLDHLAGGLAHEFNNSLTSIKGHVELARIQLPPGHQDQALWDLEKALRTATELSSYLVKVSGSEFLEPETVKIRTLLARLQSTLDSTVEVITDCPNVSVSVDPRAWLHMCQNLLDNARDSAGPEGLVRLTVETSLSWVTFRVDDDGPGLPPESRDTLLKPYFTTSQKERKSGLGLAVVAALAKQQNAGIEFRNRPEGGASVLLRFPKAEVS